MSSTPEADVEKKPPIWTVILSSVVVVLVPLVVILTVVRLIATPVFVNIEYRTPNFPTDPYGFTLDERIHYALIARDYLFNDQGISFLADLQFDDGSAVYNPRELQHMVDVKRVLQVVLIVWYFAWGAILLLGLWAWFGKWWQTYLRGLQRGGWFTVAFVVIVIPFVVFAFGVFFVFFHEIFFDPGTWIFFYSDTLIRLFPERFWRDIFLTVGIFSLLIGLAIALGLRRSVKRLE